MLKSHYFIGSFDLSYLKGSGIKLFLYLGSQSLKTGNYKDALGYVSRVIQSLHSPKNCWPQEKKELANLIVNRQYGLIYCPIPKVACSSFKELMVQLSNLENKHEALKLPHKLLHAYVKHYLTLPAQCTFQEAMNLVDSCSYFRFVVIRNPWDRLTSAYLNKFVSPLKKSTVNLSTAQEVIEYSYRQRQLTIDLSQSITFRQFVEYVVQTPDAEVDGHWRSQSSFMGDIEFDFVGRFENLDKDFEIIKKKGRFDTDLSWSNRSSRNELTFTHYNYGRYADYYPSELNLLEQYPSYQEFYTPEMAVAVEKRYSQDVSNFGYCFSN